MKKSNRDLLKALPIAAGVLLGTSILVSKCGSITKYAIDDLILGDLGTPKEMVQQQLAVEKENGTGAYNRNNKYSKEDFKEDLARAKRNYNYRVKYAKEEYSYDKEKMNEKIKNAQDNLKTDLQEAKSKLNGEKKDSELKIKITKPKLKPKTYLAHN